MSYYIKVKDAFSAAHFLTGEGLHGHNFSVEVKVYGDLNKEFMVMDFADLKNVLDNICEELDHRVLVSKSDVKSESARSIEVQNGSRYVFPRSDAVMLPVESVTTESLAKYIHFRLKEKIPDKGIHVSLSEKEGCSATYVE